MQTTGSLLRLRKPKLHSRVVVPTVIMINSELLSLDNFDYTTTAEDTDSAKLAANLVAKFNQEVANGDNQTIQSRTLAVDSAKTDTIRITCDGTAHQSFSKA